MKFTKFLRRPFFTAMINITNTAMKFAKFLRRPFFTALITILILL